MKNLLFAAIGLALAALPAQAALSDVHDFVTSDGYYLSAPSHLMKGSDGNYYGVATQGGSGSCGTLFKMVVTGAPSSPSTTFTVLHNFLGPDYGDGALPLGSVVEDGSGNFYGTTTEGGAYNKGTVFKYNASGGYQVIYSFGSIANDGEDPHGLTIDIYGSLFGTTSGGGTSSAGTIFQIYFAGGVWTETPLYSFSGGYADGGYPFATMAAGTDGYLYGVTSFGGHNTGGGTAFQFVPGYNTLTTIYNFTYPTNTGSNGLVQVSSSGAIVLFGTTPGGGTHSKGTVYSLTQDNFDPTVFTYATVHNFAGGGSDGQSPVGDLLVSTDNGGSCYGTTQAGGASSSGVLYNLTFGGTLAIEDSLTDLTCAGVIRASIGGTPCLMGSYYSGGANYCGEIWTSYGL